MAPGGHGAFDPGLSTRRAAQDYGPRTLDLSLPGLLTGEPDEVSDCDSDESDHCSLLVLCSHSIMSGRVFNKNQSDRTLLYMQFQCKIDIPIFPRVVFFGHNLGRDYRPRTLDPGHSSQDLRPGTLGPGLSAETVRLMFV